MDNPGQSSSGPLVGIIIIMFVLLSGAVYVITGHQISAYVPQEEVYIPSDISTTSTTTQ